jgi:hypothetical protein
VEPPGVGVLVGGLPAALTEFEGIFSKANTSMPMTIILNSFDLRIMTFSPLYQNKLFWKNFLTSFRMI